ncbi:hypothetical protein [Paraburkholderia ferrariae]|nr:hypothetical protein [Paraburkholderia ferrariae]
MPRPFVSLAPARSARTIRTTCALRGMAAASAFASTLALSGCYYY